VPCPVSKPGDCVSVDVLVSATPGLIAQMRGFLARQRCKHAAVFIDHCSDFSCVHLMTNQDGDNTCAAKAAFEKCCQANGVNVQHCHADNGMLPVASGKMTAPPRDKASHALEQMRIISPDESRDAHGPCKTKGGAC